MPAEQGAALRPAFEVDHHVARSAVLADHDLDGQALDGLRLVLERRPLVADRRRRRFGQLLDKIGGTLGRRARHGNARSLPLVGRWERAVIRSIVCRLGTGEHPPRLLMSAYRATVLELNPPPAGATGGPPG